MPLQAISDTAGDCVCRKLNRVIALSGTSPTLILKDGGTTIINGMPLTAGVPLVLNLTAGQTFNIDMGGTNPVGVAIFDESD